MKFSQIRELFESWSKRLGLKHDLMQMPADFAEGYIDPTTHRECFAYASGYAEGLSQSCRLKDEDVRWIMNDLGELGVLIGTQTFFLYKGDSLVYSGKFEGHGGVYFRFVGKHEFGETCRRLTPEVEKAICEMPGPHFQGADINDGHVWMPIYEKMLAKFLAGDKNEHPEQPGSCTDT